MMHKISKYILFDLLLWHPDMTLTDLGLTDEITDYLKNNNLSGFEIGRVNRNMILYTIQYLPHGYFLTFSMVISHNIVNQKEYLSDSAFPGWGKVTEDYCFHLFWSSQYELDKNPFLTEE